MDTAKQTEIAARRLIAEYNKGTPDWVETCHAETTAWTELPLPGTPNGRGGGRSALRQAAEHAVAHCPDRRMELTNLVVGGDQAALEIDWTGTATSAVLGYAVGDAIRLRIAMFLRVADGKIVRQVDYCVPIPNA